MPLHQDFLNFENSNGGGLASLNAFSYQTRITNYDTVLFPPSPKGYWNTLASTEQCSFAQLILQGFLMATLMAPNMFCPNVAVKRKRWVLGIFA